MALFRNLSSGTVKQSALNEENHAHLSINNNHTHGNFGNSGRDNEEIFGPVLSKKSGEYGGSNFRAENTQQPSTRSANVVGKWGSSFWKDRQPMESHGGLESGEESKSGSEYKGSELEGDSNGVEDRIDSENDEIRQKEVDDKVRQRVLADDMLSDEYYEQDDDERLHHHRTLNKTSRFSSKPPPRSAARNSVHKKSIGLKADQYDDETIDYEEEDNDDEDDPEDDDFYPDYGATSGGRGNKDKDEDWDGEDSDDDIDDDDLNISDEDDSFGKKNRAKQRGKGANNLKSTREFKSVAPATRRRRVRTSFEDEEESSADDSENDSNEDFKNMRRLDAPVRRKNGNQFVSDRNNELRTSGRSVRKVSYVESDESEDLDEGKKKKNQKDEVEEEDGDAIEKVLWHQPKGMAEEALRNNRSVEPTLLNYLFDSEPDWNEVEFLIKWKGQSHLHCQWKSFSELQNLSGFKKVLNYTKKVMEDVKYRKTVSREEIEVNDVSKEMDLDIIKQNSQVERIISDRLTNDGLGNVVPEYLVKWQGLSYAEATWEKDTDIVFAQDAIDEYKEDVSI